MFFGVFDFVLTSPQLPFVGPSWPYLGPSWACFGVILGPSGGHFGILLDAIGAIFVTSSAAMGGTLGLWAPSGLILSLVLPILSYITPTLARLCSF